MTQEDKELLLKDLCARLPYGVMVKITSDGGMVEASYDMRLDAGLLADLLHSEDDFMPYLRTKSSMTTEEYKEYDLHRKHICDEYNRYCFDSVELIDWLNANHFNYRLPPHLFIEVTDENNPYKNGYEK